MAPFQVVLSYTTEPEKDAMRICVCVTVCMEWLSTSLKSLFSMCTINVHKRGEAKGGRSLTFFFGHVLINYLSRVFGFFLVTVRTVPNGGFRCGRFGFLGHGGLDLMAELFPPQNTAQMLREVIEKRRIPQEHLSRRTES